MYVISIGGVDKKSLRCWISVLMIRAINAKSMVDDGTYEAYYRLCYLRYGQLFIGQVNITG